jgi:hypothetical protein
MSEREVAKAIAAIKDLLFLLEAELVSTEGIWKSDAERIVPLAEDLRGAIFRYMGEEP